MHIKESLTMNFYFSYWENSEKIKKFKW